eukprot:TRINITY_DN7720_c0_g1_i2.p1 TRINITY_DN7720_c0_g1~~TRINITY_DN7720_c0_g1_i2.p1  ORF type:complete len:142 (+),score=11.66 TRINITY_DN7720_c0_g1_i2:101-526(+)
MNKASRRERKMPEKQETRTAVLTFFSFLMTPPINPNITTANCTSGDPMKLHSLQVVQSNQKLESTSVPVDSSVQGNEQEHAACNQLELQKEYKHEGGDVEVEGACNRRAHEVRSLGYEDKEHYYVGSVHVAIYRAFHLLNL